LDLLYFARLLPHTRSAIPTFVHESPTSIFKEQDGKRVRATFEDFKMGQLIEAQFVDGPTVMIYPLQVAAAEIVILNNVKEE
jgi:hypothetical protein